MSPSLFFGVKENQLSHYQKKHQPITTADKLMIYVPQHQVLFDNEIKINDVEKSCWSVGLVTYEVQHF